MTGAPAPSATPEQAEATFRHAEVRAEEAVDRWGHQLRGSLDLAWDTLRFVVFALYVLLAAVFFWVWAVGFCLAVLRTLLRVLMIPLLWISDGAPRGPGNRQRRISVAVAQDVHTWWVRREDRYREIAKPLARHLQDGRAAAVRLWHLTVPRKLLTLIAAFFLVFVPGMYVVPRPHYVQVLDDNVIDYQPGAQNTRYLIHAVDMFNPRHTREYLNENMWWLGKINSQGMKARIEPGRFYKAWVVGLRWWYTPTLYPNLISITEVDREGRPLPEPSYLVPPTTTVQ